ncbi:hypothetical protein [Ornithinimicrobium tianjinense]|uniref:Neocarzinostatin family protein n=1 Tax=Ornithinimicrobium tianjinense TaxID=1195761 RepID=A0A917BI34_9MICO|nr:hypothetical protein [Ornithinimicrobium tianjinense]GGF46362.1 hypothetical protein GCM10011366_12620 [Ornithinimicrobium tianjinense]
MRTIARTLTAALVALPVAAAASAPAVAAAPERFSVSGESVDVQGTLLGDLDGLGGNVHLVGISAQETSGEGSMTWGSVDSYTCADGVTMPWDPETGELLCAPAGWAELSGPLTVDTDKKLTAATVAGDLTISTWTCDDEECWSEELGTLAVDLLVSGTGGTLTERSSQTYQDPTTGERYRGTMRSTTRQGEVGGTLGGHPVIDAWASFGRFSFSSTYKL